jgi:DNA-binding transcriptional regulator PaaX
MKHLRKREKGNEYAKKILLGLAVAGVVIVAANSPSFARKAPGLVYDLIRKKINAGKKEDKKKNYYNAFYYLKGQGLIDARYRHGQLFIALTDAGRKRAGRYQIDDMAIQPRKYWNHKWHILIFDISDKHKVKREALRGKLKQLGLFQLQKSVWVYPYAFKKEMKLLRDFFGLSRSDMVIVTATHIENDEAIKKYYDLA